MVNDAPFIVVVKVVPPSVTNPDAVIFPDNVIVEVPLIAKVTVVMLNAPENVALAVILRPVVKRAFAKVYVTDALKMIEFGQVNVVPLVIVPAAFIVMFPVPETFPVCVFENVTLPETVIPLVIVIVFV